VSASLLPVPQMPEGVHRHPVALALGEYCVELPRNVAEGIRDLRFPAPGQVEGLRVRDGEWIDLLAFNARIQPAADLPDLEEVR